MNGPQAWTIVASTQTNWTWSSIDKTSQSRFETCCSTHDGQWSWKKVCWCLLLILVLGCKNPKTSLKIGSANKVFWFDIDNCLKFLFRNKTFSFFKIESWNFQTLFEKEICETSHIISTQTHRKNENNNCLNNELKFCEVSENSISNRCWKFQRLSWKSEKNLFLKNIC